jgi:hypothetical protein
MVRNDRLRLGLLSGLPRRRNRWSGVSHAEPLSSVDDKENVVADYDVVIVRAPAWRRDLAARLAAIRSHTLVPADHLCYWSWERQRFTPVAAPDGFCLEETTDMSELAPLVRDAFSKYGNHYSANPLLNPSAALEGYGGVVPGPNSLGRPTRR